MGLYRLLTSFSGLSHQVINDILSNAEHLSYREMNERRWDSGSLLSVDDILNEAVPSNAAIVPHLRLPLRPLMYSTLNLFVQ